MSYGVVMCSVCQREVHQSGSWPNRAWAHCEDGSAICEGARAAYPRTPAELKGEWCGADSCGMQPEFDQAKRREKRK